jgi:hypothetical protein
MRVCLALTLTCGVLLAPGAWGVESTINPGVGIGKVKLGMTQAQVKNALGNWRYVNERQGNHLNVSWGLFGSAWSVDFVSGKVAEVSTRVRSQRTTSGIGQGSSWRALVRAYLHGLCGIKPPHTNTLVIAELLVPHKGGTQTLFYANGVKTSEQSNDRTWRVSEVHVRTSWTQLPEFNRTNGNHPIDCQSTWRTGDPYP